MACREKAFGRRDPAAMKEPPPMAKKRSNKQKAKLNAGKSRHRPRDRKIIRMDELPKR